MKLSLEVFADSNATRLFLGQLISQVCDKMMSVGLVWMFAERYPASVVPWFLGFSALPHLLLAWHAGPWAARWGQVRTLVGTDVFRGVVFGALACVWGSLSADAQLPALFAASFVANMASALFNPAIFSSPIILGDERLIQQLTALINSCFSLGNVIGPLIAAVAYQTVGLTGLFGLNAVSYFVAAALEVGIVPKAPPAPPEGEAPAEPATARQVLARDRVVTVMLAGFLASNLFLAPVMVIMPLFVRLSYHDSIGALATLESCFGCGTIVGGLFLATVKLDSRLGVKIATGMSAVALAYLGFTLSSAVWVGAACLAALGFCLEMTNVFSMTLFQTRLPPQDVPTLMSLVNLISVASLPLSMAVIGVAVKGADIRTIAACCGGGLMIATLGVIARREVREL